MSTIYHRQVISVAIILSPPTPNTIYLLVDYYQNIRCVIIKIHYGPRGPDTVTGLLIPYNQGA